MPQFPELFKYSAQVPKPQDIVCKEKRRAREEPAQKHSEASHETDIPSGISENISDEEIIALIHKAPGTPGQRLRAIERSNTPQNT